MQTFNVLVTSTELDNFDVSADFSAASWAQMVAQGVLANGVMLAINPTAGDVTLTGIASEYLETGPLIVRNAQPPGGHNVLCPATNASSEASAQFAQAFTLPPGASVALLFNPDESGMWSARILLPNGKFVDYSPGTQQIVPSFSGAFGVGTYILPAGYALGAQGSVPGQ